MQSFIRVSFPGLIFSICIAAVWLVADSASAQCSFTGLGDLSGGAFESAANGVSDDREVIVGISEGASGFEAFRWTAMGGMVGLGDLPGSDFDSSASGVSANGSVVVGYGVALNGQEAFRWTASGGMVSLGDLPFGGHESNALDVSADGSVVVGHGASSAGQEAIRWTSAGGLVGLGTLGGDGALLAVTPDGTVAAGRELIGGAYMASRWTQATGLVLIGDLPGGTSHAFAFDIADDGATIVGTSVGNLIADEPFLWTTVGGMQNLGAIAGGAFAGSAEAVSGDGTIVVGSRPVVGGSQAFIWSAAVGPRSLASELGSCGATTTGWTLRDATDISADGRIVVGSGTNPGGQTEAYRAALPEPGLLAGLQIGLLGLFAWLGTSRRGRPTQGL